MHQVAQRLSSTVRPRHSERRRSTPGLVVEFKIGHQHRPLGHDHRRDFAARKRRDLLRQLNRRPASGLGRIALEGADPVYRSPHRRADHEQDSPATRCRQPAKTERLRGPFGHSKHLGDAKGRAMSNKMWGGRFAESPDAIMEEINASIDFDRHLYRQDIAASKAHAAMLAQQGIISKHDAAEITHGLDTILSEIEGGKFTFKRELEDIHMNVESRLAELIGPAAGRLHTARSRNDQVATDFRLWIRATIDSIDDALAGYQQALAEKALAHAATVMPGFTHLQAAQPVTFGHHLLAYVEMAARDRGRFADARARRERIAARRGRACRHLVPDRPRDDHARARLRPADGEFARRRLRPRLRAGDAGGGIDHGGASLALRRGDRDLVLAARGAGAAVGSLHHRLLDHAAEAQPRRGRTGARQDRPHHRRRCRRC